MPKTHWCDACCVGISTPNVLKTSQIVPLLIEANGRGHRRIMLVNKYGFSRGYRKRQKRYFVEFVQGIHSEGGTGIYIHPAFHLLQ